MLYIGLVPFPVKLPNQLMRFTEWLESLCHVPLRVKAKGKIPFNLGECRCRKKESEISEHPSNPPQIEEGHVAIDTELTETGHKLDKSWKGLRGERKRKN